MVLNSRKEAACIQYDLHQSIGEPHVFIFHEIWESETALELHNKQPYIEDFINQSVELILEPVVIYRTNVVKE